MRVKWVCTYPKALWDTLSGSISRWNHEQSTVSFLEAGLPGSVRKKIQRKWIDESPTLEPEKMNLCFSVIVIIRPLTAQW